MAIPTILLNHNIRIFYLSKQLEAANIKLKADIEKYGLENFKWKVIKQFATRKEAEDYEFYIHKKLKVGHNPNFYNINYGQSYDITSHNRKKYKHKKSPSYKPG